jgi:hypothetical protein
MIVVMYYLVLNWRGHRLTCTVKRVIVIILSVVLRRPD